MLKEPESYNNCTKKMGLLNLSSLYNDTPISEVSTEETLMRKITNKNDYDYKALENSSIYAHDHKTYGGIEEILNVSTEDLEKAARMLRQKFNKI